MVWPGLCYTHCMTQQGPIEPAALLDLLPHRFPFLLIDRVVSATPDEVVALKNVSFGEPYFGGHFPGAPVMPGVLQVEAMAQAACVLAQFDDSFDRAKHLMVFMKIEEAKFRKPVVPGDQLRITVKPLRKGRVWQLSGLCEVDGGVVSSAQFLAALADRAAGEKA